MFNKITALTTGKPSLDSPSSQSSTPAPASHHIHRHHRNTSTVSQNENVLTSQPSTQSIGISSDQSYSSVNTENLINNGSTPPSHVSRRHAPPAPIAPSPQTSESIQMDFSPSVSSSTNTNHQNFSSPTSTPSNYANAPQTPNNNQWRHKLNNLKQSFQSVGTPRFHRRPKVLRKLHREREREEPEILHNCFLNSQWKW